MTMAGQRTIHRLSILATAGVILLALCTFGCAGDRIEYDPPDPDLVGKVVHFKESMVYIVFSDKKFAKKYGFLSPQIEGKKIQRELVSRYTVDDPNSYIHNFPIEYIKKGMAFTILGSYWQKGDWITREFAPDSRNLILSDENDILSVYLAPDNNLRDSLMFDTDFGDR